VSRDTTTPSGTETLTDVSHSSDPVTNVSVSVRVTPLSPAATVVVITSGSPATPLPDDDCEIGVHTTSGAGPAGM
jgi:hypothetical protein